MTSNLSSAIASIKDPGWVGVVVAVLALIAPIAIWILDRRRKLAAEKAAKLERADQLLRIIQKAHREIARLRDDPDDEHALSRHWREDENDPKRKVARIQAYLSRLQTIPPVDATAGMAGTESVDNLVEALTIAQNVLQREEEPITRAAMMRISDALLAAKIEAGRGFNRAVAARNAYRPSPNVGKGGAGGH